VRHRHDETGANTEAFEELTRDSNFQKMLIPKYWEQPELLTDFVKTVKMMDDGRRNKTSGRSG